PVAHLAVQNAAALAPGTYPLPRLAGDRLVAAAATALHRCRDRCRGGVRQLGAEPPGLGPADCRAPVPAGGGGGEIGMPGATPTGKYRPRYQSAPWVHSAPAAVATGAGCPPAPPGSGTPPPPPGRSGKPPGYPLR